MSKEAMKLALEAMERYQVKRQDFDRFADEITALREALAEQPAQHLSGLAVYLDPSDGLKPKRYAPQPAQHEPVVTARQLSLATRQWDHWKQYALELQEKLVKYEGGAPMVLNTSPPAQRTWVGLTDKELSEVYNQADWDTVNGWEYERAIEDKLKEKNNG